MSLPVVGDMTVLSGSINADGGTSAGTPNALGTWGNLVASTNLYTFSTTAEWVGVSAIPTGGNTVGYNYDGWNYFL